MGLFQDIHKNHFVPLLLSKDNGAGEEVTLHGETDQVVVAEVEFDEATLVEDELPDLEGRIRIKASDEGYLNLDSSPVKTATIDGELWHLFGPVSRRAGLTQINIRRSHTETKYSNLTDLNDEQAEL